jgi:hypothetical protein
MDLVQRIGAGESNITRAKREGRRATLYCVLSQSTLERDFWRENCRKRARGNRAGRAVGHMRTIRETPTRDISAAEDTRRHRPFFASRKIDAPKTGTLLQPSLIPPYGSSKSEGRIAQCFAMLFYRPSSSRPDRAGVTAGLFAASGSTVSRLFATLV